MRRHYSLHLCAINSFIFKEEQLCKVNVNRNSLNLINNKLCLRHAVLNLITRRGKTRTKGFSKNTENLILKSRSPGFKKTTTRNLSGNLDVCLDQMFSVWFGYGKPNRLLLLKCLESITKKILGAEIVHEPTSNLHSGKRLPLKSQL